MSLRWVLGIALVLVSSLAQADERPTSFVDLRAGHAGAWTTGLPPRGHTFGAAYGRTFLRWLLLELRAYYHRGSEMHTRGPDVRLDGRASAVSLEGFIGYDAWIGRHFELVPGLVLDTTLEWTDVRLASRRSAFEMSDRRATVAIGLGLPMTFHVQRVRFGVDPSALFVPTRVASPVVQMVGVLGVDF